MLQVNGVGTDESHSETLENTSVAAIAKQADSETIALDRAMDHAQCAINRVWQQYQGAVHPAWFRSRRTCRAEPLVRFLHWAALVLCVIARPFRRPLPDAGSDSGGSGSPGT